MEGLAYSQKYVKTNTIFILHTDMDNTNIQLDAYKLERRKLLKNVIHFGEKKSLILREDGHNIIETLIH